MNLHLYPLELPLQHVFRTSVVERSVQPTLIVSLEEKGLHGFGECTENAFFGASLKHIIKEIEEVRPLIEAAPGGCSPQALHHQLQATHLHAFALSALDVAMHDLRGKQQKKPLYALWGLKPKPLPTSYTIGLDTIENMQQKIREKPWPIYKIKLGSAEDLALIRALREVTEATFRVDVNGAWGLEESIAKSQALQALGVEFIEQPLPKEAAAEQAQLYKASALPLIADESCETEEDMAQCVGRFHGVNIKLSKCGGLTPAKRMLEAAQALGLRTMMGCMVESSVGISAIAQLVPLLDYVDMDGAMLLAYDPATGVTLHEKGLQYSLLPGTGAALKPEHV